MTLWAKLRAKLKTWSPAPTPVHLQRGTLGETAAKKYLTTQGLRFLTANYSSRRGEIDLIFREADCLVFVEVKTRSGGWTRPARAVDPRKRLALIRTAHDYLRELNTTQVRYRFDVVEVLLQGEAVHDIRHIRGSFNSSTALRRGR